MKLPRVRARLHRTRFSMARELLGMLSMTLVATLASTVMPRGWGQPILFGILRRNRLRMRLHERLLRQTGRMTMEVDEVGRSLEPLSKLK